MFHISYITLWNTVLEKLLVTQLVNTLDALCVTARFTTVFACGPCMRKMIAAHYMPRGNTVTSATYEYADLLKNHLRPAIKSKRRGRLSTGVLLQHDNARPHTARSAVATIQDLSFECLPHPPYTPDLVPSDFHVFGLLKQAMGSKSFRSDEEVQQAVQKWLRSQPKQFLSRGIQALPKRCNTCMERNGDYINHEIKNI